MIIGSHHFVFEDEGSVIPEDGREQYESLPPEYSHLYMAVGGRLAAVICIIDPLREEAASVVSQLRALGLSKIVIMTGDSDRTAKAIAQKVGVDEYYSEVLPEDKASFVEAERAAGRKVIMVGDQRFPCLISRRCGNRHQRGGGDCQGNRGYHHFGGRTGSTGDTETNQQRADGPCKQKLPVCDRI